MLLEVAASGGPGARAGIIRAFPFDTVDDEVSDCDNGIFVDGWSGVESLRLAADDGHLGKRKICRKTTGL